MAPHICSSSFAQIRWGQMCRGQMIYIAHTYEQDFFKSHSEDCRWCRIISLVLIMTMTIDHVDSLYCLRNNCDVNFRQPVHMVRMLNSFCVSHGRFLSGCMSQYPTTSEKLNPTTRNLKSYDSIIAKHKTRKKASEINTRRGVLDCMCCCDGQLYHISWEQQSSWTFNWTFNLAPYKATPL